MIRNIFNALMQSLARIIPAIKVDATKTATSGVVYRRVEVTVERESLSLWVRGPSAGGAEGLTTVNALVDRAPDSGSGRRKISRPQSP